jgi:NAD(P)-dependent dehydrogenase (short-subunit alcohol dehydrogenase family)
VITCSRHAFPENCPWADGPEDHIQVDLSDPADTLRAIGEMKERLPVNASGGRTLHALVNNAGISPKGFSSPPQHEGSVATAYGRDAEQSRVDPRSGSGGGVRLTTLTTEMATWRQVFEVNLFATVWLARGLMEELARAQGAIVNVTSIAGGRVHPFAGAAYSTSKAALAALTREMASDFGPLGVRVNAIAPGEIDTAILSPGTDKIVDTIPLRRLGLPEEVAKAIYYLCTDQSSYVTGAELHINGGQHV